MKRSFSVTMILVATVALAIAWNAEPAKVIRKLNYRADGTGYLKDGYNHLFVLPAEGGTPRQLTSGDASPGITPSTT